MFKKKIIVHEMLAIGFTVAQLLAPPLSEEEVERLHLEACYKSDWLRKSLIDVTRLEERQTLVNRAIGFIILADVTHLPMELVSAIISAPYFDRWIPSKDTRDIENLPNCIDPFQLAYIVTPSDEMDATLRKAQERVAYPPIDWTNEDVRRRHKEMGPFTEMYFLARQDTDMPLPSIGEGVSGPRWMPKYPSRSPDGQLDERFFIDWWQNIYREFIETEGFASCYRLLEKTLKRALKKEQSIDAFVEKFKKQMPQANGLVGMSLNALKGKDALMREKYPQWSEFIDALQRQINTAPGQ